MNTSSQPTMRRVKTTMLWTDLGFLTYWLATAFGVISVGSSRILNDWNWSFFGLDILAISTGLLSLLLMRKGHRVGESLMLISLTLTSTAGLMALNFYILRGQFDLAWWLPNLWLFLFPLVSLVILLGKLRHAPQASIPNPA